MSLQYYLRGGGIRPPDLFVATTSGFVPKPNYVAALAETTRLLAMKDLEVEWLLHSGDPHVDDARNACVAIFLESGAPKMLFIDDDVGWVPDEFLKFIKHDRDVVAAIYPKKKDEPDYPVMLIPGALQAEPDGLLEVKAVPTGFLMLSRAAVMAIANDSMHFHRKDSRQTPLMFERGVLNGERWSGDYWFSRKWTERGGRCWVDPEMTFTHVGLKTWEGCLGDHLRKNSDIIDPYLDGAFRLLQSGVVNSDIWAVLSARCGNYPYCAPEEMMDACYRMAKDSRGPILETGSGLTTIIMGMAIDGTDTELHTLEHDYKWFKKTRQLIARYDLKNVRLHYAPIKEYDGTEASAWYTLPESLPESFGLVVCDGPPRKVSDRMNLWRLLGSDIDLADWIVDDVERGTEAYEVNGRAAEVISRFAIVRHPQRKAA